MTESAGAVKKSMAYRKFENSRQFFKDSAQKEPQGIYLFLGEEEGEKDKAIAIIIDKVFAGSTEGSTHTGRFHIENDELLPAYDFAMSGSMFSAKKVCVMRGINGLKQDAASMPLFTDLIENVSAGSILIMTSVENRPPAFIGKTQLEKIRVVQFWRYFERDLRLYIVKKAGEQGIAFDDDGIAKLIARTGKDIKKIDDALGMLKYKAGSGSVSAGDIGLIISDWRNFSIFEFIELLFQGDKSSFRALGRILDEGSPELQILHMVARQADLLERFHSKRMENIPPDEAIKICGVGDRNRDSFLAQAGLFPPWKLKKVFQLIAHADMELKSPRVSMDAVANPVFSLVSGILFGI